MLNLAKKPGGNLQSGFLSILLVLVALVLGMIGALGGWFAQIFLLSILVPAIFLILNYRIGVFLSIIFLPFAHSQIIPKIGPLSPTNILLLGTICAFVIHCIGFWLRRRSVDVPVPRELLIFYILPITLGGFIGSFHLGQIPDAFLLVNNHQSFGLVKYWVSVYLKEMLYVVLAVVIAAYIVERGRGMAIAKATISAGLLFSFAIFAIILNAGLDLNTLRFDRGFLSILGTHNNQAGSLLLMPFAATLFIREFVSSSWSRTLYGLSAAALLVAILLTFSRGAFVGVLAIVLFYVYYFKRLKTAFFATALLLLGLALAPNAVQERLLTGLGGGMSIGEQLTDTGGKDDELTAGRVRIWYERLSDIKRSPFWGNGLYSGAWSDVVKAGNNYLDNAHSLYLTILTDLGFLGLFLMILFYRYLWRLFRELEMDTRVEVAMRGYFLAGRAMLFAIPIAGIAGGTYMPGLTRWLLWVAIGVAIGYRRSLTTAVDRKTIQDKPRSNSFDERTTGGVI